MVGQLENSNSKEPQMTLIMRIRRVSLVVLIGVFCCLLSCTQHEKSEQEEQPTSPVASAILPHHDIQRNQHLLIAFPIDENDEGELEDATAFVFCMRETLTQAGIESEVIGGVQREFLIRVAADRQCACGISFTEIHQAPHEKINLIQFTGRIDESEIRQMEDIIVPKANDRMIRFMDVASIQHGFDSENAYVSSVETFSCLSKVIRKGSLVCMA